MFQPIHQFVHYFSVGKANMAKSKVPELYENPWGLGPAVNWTNPRLGWDADTRWRFDVFMKMNYQQSLDVPSYTELGYEKMAIPSELYKVDFTSF